MLKSKNYDISKITNHKNFNAQKAEWCELGLATTDGLFENENLPLDTKHFNDLKDEIEALFSENELNGTLIKSENFQALNTILPRFKNSVDLIYIDPPFNTDSDFAYIDKFQDSTWLTLMENRLNLAKEFLSENGSLYLHLDNKANYYGRMLLDSIFGKENFRNEIIWTFGGKGLTNKKNGFINYYNSILFFSKTNDLILNLKNGEISESVLSRFGKYFDKDNYGIIYFSALKNSGDKLELEKARKSFIKENGREPIDNDIARDYSSGALLKDVWDNIPIIRKNETYGEYIDYDEDLTQKPEALLQRIIKASSNENSIVMDFFSGSGTTVTAALKLNRKFIGIEMGEHFESVIIPRIKKAIGGFECGISKECDYKGGGVVKYYEFERYEQILEKIALKDMPDVIIKNAFGEFDPFLFDEKLSYAVDENLNLDLDKIYKNIDLKQTILNATKKEVKSVNLQTNEVIFKDGKKENLLKLIKRHLIW